LTESAEQRTKRRFIEYMDLTTWTHQYSFFYQSPEDARACALSDATKLKEKLRKTKALKSQPFLYRLCLRKANAYHMVFTTKAVDLELLRSIALKTSEVEIRVLGKKLPDWKIESYKKRVSRQEPHNLVGFFGDKKINRIALLNVKAIEKTEI
jgi:hypothetical protein